MDWPIVKRGRIKISTIRPDECMHLRITTYLIKKKCIHQRSEKLALKNWTSFAMLVFSTLTFS